MGRCTDIRLAVQGHREEDDGARRACVLQGREVAGEGRGVREVSARVGGNDGAVAIVMAASPPHRHCKRARGVRTSVRGGARARGHVQTVGRVAAGGARVCCEGEGKRWRGMLQTHINFP
jgi:hypothetical protein